jgi:hypothetical protein
VKNGVTRSVIPWTYEAAGLRIARMNRTRSIALGTQTLL